LTLINQVNQHPTEHQNYFQNGHKLKPPGFSPRVERFTAMNKWTQKYYNTPIKTYLYQEITIVFAKLLVSANAEVPNLR